MSCKKNDPEIYKENTRAGMSLLMKLQMSCNFFLKKDSGAGVFPVNFTKLLKSNFFTENLCVTAF